MTKTEKEARHQFCPMALANSRDTIDNCRASDCMAWRWGMGQKQIAPPSECAACSGKGTMPNDVGEPGVCPECDGEGKLGHFEKIGYCGLAGRPNIG